MKYVDRRRGNGSVELSIVVCSYDMQRELPRTLYTLSRDYQRDIDALEYEIIVVDNGSPEPMDLESLCAAYDNVRGIRLENSGNKSPADAINKVVEETQGDWIGIFIDGARMASPGLLATAREAYTRDSTKVIGTLGFHLGTDVQMASIQEGYDQGVEDVLLFSVPWRENGYYLFEISVLSGSCQGGWYEPIAESTATFMGYQTWKALGGFDVRFESAGGGYVNLDFWRRAVEQSDYCPWILLGEGTFHQIHGGAATNSPQTERNQMKEEYQRLINEPFDLLDYSPRYVGKLLGKYP